VSTGVTEFRLEPPEWPELRALIPASELLLFSRDLRGTVRDAVVAAAGRALLAGAETAPAVCQAGTGVGVAVDTGHGLLVPVVRNAGDDPLPQVRTDVARLVAAASTGTLAPAEIGGAAVTVCECRKDVRAVAAEAPPSRILSLEWPGVDSLELTLFRGDGEPAAGGDGTGLFFATLVRLLRHPYRLLV